MIFNSAPKKVKRRTQSIIIGVVKYALLVDYISSGSSKIGSAKGSVSTPFRHHDTHSARRPFDILIGVCVSLCELCVYSLLCFWPRSVDHMKREV